MGADMLAELARLHAAASPGPWLWEGSIYQHMAVEICAVRGIAQLWKGPHAMADAALIVAVFNSLPRLLDIAAAYERQLAEIETLKRDNGCLLWEVEDAKSALTKAKSALPQAKADGEDRICKHGIRWPWACDDCDQEALAAWDGRPR